MAENSLLPTSVSVIVPIYQSEPYLDRCVQSLFAQTLESIEYIFIIDGPSETADKLLSRAVSAYPRRVHSVRIIHHQQNLGTSYSRQEGHNQAAGEYLYHCDSDDWLEKDALELLIEKARKESADLVFFDYVRHYESGIPDVVYSSSSVLSGHINTIDGTLCNKLIRRQLVESHALQFPSDINWGEDLCMSVLLQTHARKISYLPRVLYHYCIREESFTGTLSHQKYMQLVRCPLYIEEALAKEGLTQQYEALLMQMKFEVKEYFLINRSLRDLPAWMHLYPECHSYICQFTGVPNYLKVVVWLTLHHLSGVALLLLTLRDQINQFRFKR